MIEAAVAGLGAAVTQSALVGGDPAAGRLTAPHGFVADDASLRRLRSGRRGFRRACPPLHRLVGDTGAPGIGEASWPPARGFVSYRPAGARRGGFDARDGLHGRAVLAARRPRGPKPCPMTRWCAAPGWPRRRPSWKAARAARARRCTTPRSTGRLTAIQAAQIAGRTAGGDRGRPDPRPHPRRPRAERRQRRRPDRPAAVSRPHAGTGLSDRNEPPARRRVC